MEVAATTVGGAGGDGRSLRPRFDPLSEVGLALPPTVTVLLVFLLVEAFSRQRLLFASLASSAFLIYLDPQHATNSVRTLTLSQFSAAAVGFGCSLLLGDGYASGGVAMVVTILVMVLANAVHPPAVSTALGFAFRAGTPTNVALFLFAVLLVAVLVVLQRVMLRAMRWALSRKGKEGA
jgi:CBS-domain-containing membrane protein